MCDPARRLYVASRFITLWIGADGFVSAQLPAVFAWPAK